MTKVFLRTENNYDMFEASRESGCECLDKSLTQQGQAEEADINTIVRRFGISQQLPVNVRAPILEDFDEVFDFQSAMLAIKSAEASFMSMPASIRASFGNDPQEFVNFCSIEENLPALRSMGLAHPLAPKEPSAPPA